MTPSIIKIQTGRNGENVIVTNDGATILKHIAVIHPAAKMLVDLSAAQDVEAGDGTTSVVIIAGSLLSVAEKLLLKGRSRSFPVIVCLLLMLPDFPRAAPHHYFAIFPEGSCKGSRDIAGYVTGGLLG